MDDRRIRELAEEVLRDLRGGTPARPSDLEGRVAALEVEVARLRQRALPMVSEVPTVHVHVEQGSGHVHPSLQSLGVSGGSARCVLEPDKPCVQSGQCRALGH